LTVKDSEVDKLKGELNDSRNKEQELRKNAEHMTEEKSKLEIQISNIQKDLADNNRQKEEIDQRHAEALLGHLFELQEQLEASLKDTTSLDENVEAPL
jgi:chromosome segregation ATPase